MAGAAVMDEGERDHLDEQIARQAGTIRRFQAALRLLSPDDITPAGRRVLENILDAEGHRDSTELCKHCSETIYQTDMGRWRHTNGMYTCTIQMPRPRPKAEPVMPTQT